VNSASLVIGVRRLAFVLALIAASFGGLVGYWQDGRSAPRSAGLWSLAPGLLVQQRIDSMAARGGITLAANVGQLEYSIAVSGPVQE
jgi:hypothetical protein